MMRNICLYLLIFCLSPGCISLQRVNDYSVAAGKSLDKFEELDATFSKICRDKCRLEQIREVRVADKPCDCKEEKSADSVTNVMYTIVKGYYNGLTKLSGNNVTNYKVDALRKSLTSGRYGGIVVDKAEVDAYTKLSSVLLRAFAEGYRQKKIKAYVEEANEPIQILVGALQLNLSTNLYGRFNVQKQRIQSLYTDFVNDSIASSFEKKAAIVEYNNLVEEADGKQKQLLAFSRALKTIGAGHQKLFEQRNKMTSDEIKLLLVQHASELEDIISEFNKLKSDDN